MYIIKLKSFNSKHPYKSHICVQWMEHWIIDHFALILASIIFLFILKLWIPLLWTSCNILLVSSLLASETTYGGHSIAFLTHLRFITFGDYVLPDRPRSMVLPKECFPPPAEGEAYLFLATRTLCNNSLRHKHSGISIISEKQCPMVPLLLQVYGGQSLNKNAT